MKKVLIILLILASIFLAYKILKKESLSRIGVFSDDEMSSQDIILLDSVAVNDKMIYWFSYDLGARGYSRGMLSYSEGKNDITDNNIFFASSYITNIEYKDKEEELVVHLYENQHANSSDTEILLNPKFKITMREDGNPMESMDFKLMKIDSAIKRPDF